MKNVYSVKDKLTLFLLAAGVFCFGILLPDSLSDHIKLVHFSAHFGMSFLLALCFYLFCTVKLRISKLLSYTILIGATLSIGVIYKYWEIASQGTFERFSFSTAVQLTGALTSMSQNLSGLMAAMLLIEGLVDRNLIFSLMRSGNIHLGPVGIRVNAIPFGKSPAYRQTPADRQPIDQQTSHSQTNPFGVGMPARSQFSPEASEK